MHYSSQAQIDCPCLKAKYQIKIFGTFDDCDTNDDVFHFTSSKLSIYWKRRKKCKKNTTYDVSYKLLDIQTITRFGNDSTHNKFHHSIPIPPP